jgi:hypothetical protein
MKRRLYIALTLLSLTLCIATGVFLASHLFHFWHWSYRFTTTREEPRVEYVFGVQGGVYAFRESYERSSVPRPPVPPERQETAEIAKWDAQWGIGAYRGFRVWGFEVESGPIGKTDAAGQFWTSSRRQSIRLPYLWLIVIFAALPAHWAITRLRQREAFRRRHGLCVTCGYDLRASKERCPECGSPITPSPAATTGRE